MRVRHKGSVSGWSSWSSTVSFKTVNLLGWVAKLGGSSTDYFYSVTTAIEGSTTYIYAVGCEDSSTGNGLDEALITKWDSSGNLIWQKKLGGSSHDYFSSVTTAIEGSTTYIYAVGREYSSTGNYEALISKWLYSGQITTGALAGIPQLSLNNSALTVGNSALSVGNPALTVGNPGLTRVYSAY